MSFGAGVCDVWLDSSRVVPAGCSGMSSGLSIKAGREFLVSLRFAEFGTDSLVWTPLFQYVEPGGPLDGLLQPPSNYKDYLWSST